MTHNLHNSDLSEFVKFIFEHPLANQEQDEKPWYWDDDLDLDFNPTEILALYEKLFSEPVFLLNKYSEELLEQGFWAMQSCLLPCSVAELIWDVQVSRELRKKVVFSMPSLYGKLFALNPLETSSNMWWDSIAYGFYCGNKSRDRSEEEKEMQDAIFEALDKILQLESLDCQIAALHGLGHLRHPDTEILINKYLESNSKIDSEIRKYAISCISGEIQ